MSDITLGTVPDENSNRDAIHVAIYPIVAGEDVKPGQHVGILEGKSSIHAPKKVGIVDPFLTKKVKAGEMFWLMLYQKTVTGMRHHWAHPDFEDVEIEKSTAVEDESIIWMKNYAEEINVTYKELMESANNWIEYGDYLVQGGKFEGMSVPDDFWDHFYNITGKRGKGSFFSCSC